MSDVMPTPAPLLGNARYDGLISVRESAPQGMIVLRGDLASVPIKNAATGISGLDMPSARGVRFEGERGVVWMSPDELLLLCPYGEVAGALRSLSGTLSDSHALAVDISDARCMFELRGSGLRDVLAKLTPADMSTDALQPGEARRSRLAQVPAAFWLQSETSARVICFRSVARYVFDLLKTAAQPGSTVGFH
ncbi:MULTISPECIES: sarcosine oxidase subunit gamma [unclassified Marinovum]